MVDRIIRERLEDGQFDECDLTLRDLERIREAFVAQLLGMYHRRIEYPQNKIVEIESRRAAGGQRLGRWPARLPAPWRIDVRPRPRSALAGRAGRHWRGSRPTR